MVARSKQTESLDVQIQVTKTIQVKVVWKATLKTVQINAKNIFDAMGEIHESRILWQIIVKYVLVMKKT